jgi:hypothetical protein
MSLCDTCRNYIRSRDNCLFADHVASCNTYKCDRYEETENEPKFVSADNPTSTHPTHYSRLNPEPGDVAREWELTFWLGDAVKYISRAGYKVGNDIIQDLEKARHCIDKEIEYQKQLKSSDQS